MAAQAGLYLPHAEVDLKIALGDVRFEDDEHAYDGFLFVRENLLLPSGADILGPLGRR